MPMSGFFNFSKDEHLDKVLNKVKDFKFGQYRNYPSKNESGWVDQHQNYIKQLVDNPEWKFHFDETKGEPFFIGCRFSKWDSEQLGLNTAIVVVLLGSNDLEKGYINQRIKSLDDELSKLKVEFAILRLNGDLLDFIHAFEANGYNYYENIIWPVLKTENFAALKTSKVRLANKDDFGQIFNIAINNTYERSHFYCDSNLNRQKVDGIYTKIVKYSWDKGDHFVVIEDDEKIQGYFIFKDDEWLSKQLGFKYARMYSLALDKNSRGKGFGSEIFEGMIAIAKEQGAEIIDSGYASKNHKSAYLHAMNRFYSVYEEITFHKTFINRS